jgi:DNA-directed RNA polymerase subunit L
MKLTLVEKTDDSVKIRIGDANMTLITPLLNKLSEDPDVSIVRFLDRHPELEEPALSVTVKKGAPEDAIKKAAGMLSEYYSSVNISK